MDPAQCTHCQACWRPYILGTWEYGCRSCGLRASGLTLEAAKTLFGLRAEKIKVRALMEKRVGGESLAAHEEAMIAYSPFGTASRCGY